MKNVRTPPLYLVPVLAIWWATQALAQPAPPDSIQADPDTPASEGSGAPVDLEAIAEGSGDAGFSQEDETFSGVRIGPITAAIPPEEIARIGGSAYQVPQEQLETWEQDDPHAVLMQVPGVYVRQEDGYGLRPNIGLRGANSDRSARVTLMEDGILFGPAPYSAPAAYYFPMMSRAVAVEVFKGPAAVAYGPATVGGAINLVMRDVPEETSGQLDLSGSTDLTGKVHGWIGTAGENWGVLVEGLHLHSEGYKTLDWGGEDTGFSRSEFMARARYVIDPWASVRHRFNLKLGFARELSDETYLGLTEADFAADPYRRYGASALDEMRWWRTQGQLQYAIESDDGWTLRATAYRHDLARAWRKFSGFRGYPAAFDLLTGPLSGQRRVYYDLLTGAQDSLTPDEDAILGTNDRTYFSQGVQLDTTWERTHETWSQRLTAGVRVHNDAVERNHTEENYGLESRNLVLRPDSEVQTADNTGSALALATWVVWQPSVAGLTLAPGIRFEAILTTFEDRAAETQTDASQFVLVPGLGAHYALTDIWGLIAGAHRGFNPVAPGPTSDTEPESSLNYEAGVRAFDPVDNSLFEVIGFWNAYTNLSGTCTFAGGCTEAQVDRQFNAGEARILGVEVAAARRFAVGAGLEIPVRASYTFTDASFLTSFVSENPQFGRVDADDALPYVPRHQASFEAGLTGSNWGVAAVGLFVDEMLEQAGTFADEETARTDRLLTLDATAWYLIAERWRLYLRGDNLTGTQAVVSRRPYGARPNRPRSALVGVKVDL